MKSIEGMLLIIKSKVWDISNSGDSQFNSPNLRAGKGSFLG